jgi:hypothetical protein
MTVLTLTHTHVARTHIHTHTHTHTNSHKCLEVQEQIRPTCQMCKCTHTQTHTSCKYIHIKCAITHTKPSCTQKQTVKQANTFISTALLLKKNDNISTSVSPHSVCTFQSPLAKPNRTCDNGRRKFGHKLVWYTLKELDYFVCRK